MSSGSSILEFGKQVATGPRWGRFRGIVYRYAFLFVLYALSIGPMYWRWYEAVYASGSSWVVAFYYPLWVLAGVFPPLGHFLNWYVRLWIL